MTTTAVKWLLLAMLAGALVIAFAYAGGLMPGVDLFDLRLMLGLAGITGLVLALASSRSS